MECEIVEYAVVTDDCGEKRVAEFVGPLIAAKLVCKMLFIYLNYIF